MTKHKVYYEIQLTFVDEKNNGFVKIGGAAFETSQDQKAAFGRIPSHPDYESTRFIADLIDIDGWTVLSQKPVSSRTCEGLMSRPISEMIDEGRKNTCFTLGDLRKKYPDLCKG